MPSPRSLAKLRIGPVIAVSLLAGFVAAVVGVLLPFGGAPEHVISAVALLAFASGWALLAVLSIRFTDQPQRWALIPAGVLAVVGGGLFVWPGAVSYEPVSWIWPVVFLVLVIWMTAQARAHVSSRAKTWLLYPVFGVLALAAMAAIVESILESRDRGTLAMDGRLVDVGGRRLFLRVSGTGGPTVVLLPGAGEPAAIFGSIEPLVARDTRVCVFDRAGRGWSEPAPGPQDGRQLAADLHTLLSRGQVPGPYVLAGHSFGGLLALTFAAEYPRDVAGMVLLDSTHPEMFTRLPSYPAFYEIFRRVSALFPSFARFGVTRWVNYSNGDSLPPAARDAERASWSTARHARSQRDEWAAAPALMKQARSLETFGSRPLIVVTAARGAQTGWLPLQSELARLSTNSAHRILPNASHMSLVQTQTNAVIVNQAIRDVVEAVRGSTVVRGS